MTKIPVVAVLKSTEPTSGTIGRAGDRDSPIKGRGKQLAFLGLAGILAMVAAYSWLNYVAQGIAYGAIVGLPGREQDLATFGSLAMRFLEIALCSEAMAVATVSWFFASACKPAWLRLGIAVGAAAVANVLTFAVVRGL